MGATKHVIGGLLVVVLLAGCLVPRRGGGVTVVAPLPPVVVSGAQPYYAQHGYKYHYQDDRWTYSRSKRGPWVELPRDHYPKEVRYKKGGARQGGQQKPERRDK